MGQSPIIKLQFLIFWVILILFQLLIFKNQKLKDEIETLKQKRPEASSSTIEHFKQRIKELDSEVIKGRENYEALAETLRSLKKQLNEKNAYIDELNSNYALVNTERNCYRKMVEDFDQEKVSKEYEIIISQLKQSRGGELNEIQLCNNTSIQFEEVSGLRNF